MKFNFNNNQKVPDFKMLKQPGILSFDKVFLNSLNLGCCLVSLAPTSRDAFLTLIYNKIKAFEQNLNQTASCCSSWYMQTFTAGIDQVTDLLATDLSTINCLGDVLDFLETNRMALALLSSIWCLSNNPKKPCWCETRKHFVIDTLNHGINQNLLSKVQPDFNCQKLSFDNQPDLTYLLLPSNFDIVDVCLWTYSLPDLWTKYWDNLHQILDQLNPRILDLKIVKQTASIDPHTMVSCELITDSTLVAFNYLTNCRTMKDYQTNLASLAPSLNQVSHYVIIDPINGYYLVSK